MDTYDKALSRFNRYVVRFNAGGLTYGTIYQIKRELMDWNVAEQGLEMARDFLEEILTEQNSAVRAKNEAFALKQRIIELEARNTQLDLQNERLRDQMDKLL